MVCGERWGGGGGGVLNKIVLMCNAIKDEKMEFMVVYFLLAKFKNVLNDITTIFRLPFLRPATLLKKTLRHWCFPVTFAKFSKHIFPQNTSGGCFLFFYETVLHIT